MARKNKNKNKIKTKKELNIETTNQAMIIEEVPSRELRDIPIQKFYNEEKKPKGWFRRLIDWLKEKQVLSKIFVVCFSLAVFSYTYFDVEASKRSGLAYIGCMMAIIFAYVEILTIRDHLWIIEGSMPESRKWRELLFNPISIRKQKFRKIIVLFFSLVVYAVIYRMKDFPGAKSSLSFIGIMLMITMVYYEILSIRDEVASLSKSVQQLALEKAVEIIKNE